MGHSRTMAQPETNTGLVGWVIGAAVGALTGIAALLRVFKVEKPKAESEGDIAKANVNLELEKSILEYVDKQQERNLAFFQGWIDRIQADFDSRINKTELLAKENEQEAKGERAALLVRMEDQRREDDFKYSELDRQMAQLRESHLTAMSDLRASHAQQLHESEIRHKEELHLQQIKHTQERAVDQAQLTIIRSELNDLKNKPQYSGVERRSHEPGTTNAGSETGH